MQTKLEGERCTLLRVVTALISVSPALKLVVDVNAFPWDRDDRDLRVTTPITFPGYPLCQATLVKEQLGGLCPDCPGPVPEMSLLRPPAAKQASDPKTVAQ